MDFLFLGISSAPELTDMDIYPFPVKSLFQGYGKPKPNCVLNL